MTRQIDLRFISTDYGIRSEIFNAEVVPYGAIVEIAPGLEITNTDPEKIGAFESVDVVNIAISAGASVPLSLLSQWIWEKLQRKKTKEISINGVVFTGKQDDLLRLLDRIESENIKKEKMKPEITDT